MTRDEELQQLAQCLRYADEVGYHVVDHEGPEHDQRLAANRDAFDLTLQLGDLLGATGGETQTPGDARLKAMLIAGVFRCEAGTRCQHAKQAANLTLPLIAVLGARVLTCQACMPLFAATAADPRHDNECDLCLTRGHTMFTGFVDTVVSIAVHGNACDTCAELLPV